MTKPHKHAAVIKAWADGAEIQFAFPVTPTHFDPLAQRDLVWHTHDCTPNFSDDLLYRVKPEAQEWQAERDAFARGATIQCRATCGGCSKGWFDVLNPTWGSADQGVEYRVKPKPHKWQKEIDAFNRGERVQLSNDGGSTWTDLVRGAPVDWDWFSMFRVPHKWQDEMDAQAAGKVVEASIDGGKTWYKSALGRWRFSVVHILYRIAKPTVRIRAAAMSRPGSLVWVGAARDEAQAKAMEANESFIQWLGDWVEVEAPNDESGGLAAVEKLLRTYYLGDCDVKVGWGVDFAEPGGDKTLCGRWSIDSDGRLTMTGVGFL